MVMCVHHLLCIGASGEDDNGEVSSGDGVVTSGSRPVIVPRVGTNGQGPVSVPKVGRYGQRPATVSSCGRGSQQPVTTPEKVLYGQRFMASGQPSTIRPSDDQPSVGVPSPNVPSDDQPSVSVQVLMYRVMINLL